MPGDAGSLDFTGVQGRAGPVCGAVNTARDLPVALQRAAGHRLLAAKSQDQLDQPDRQGDVTKRHDDLVRDMPVQLGKLVKTVEEIQDQKDNAEQHDAAANEAMTQIAEQDDRRFSARNMRPRRYDQSADDHLFDVTENFLGGLLDMIGVERKPPGSEIPHWSFLKSAVGFGRMGPERIGQTAVFPSFTASRSRSKNPAWPILQKRRRAMRNSLQHPIN
jgi:hypothetical protein